MTDPAPRAWQAKTITEITKTIALRHRIFCEGGLERCNVESPGDPHDQYDKESLHFGASYGGKAIATARLMVQDLPTERLLDRLPGPPLSVLADKRYSELSRLGVRDEYQGTRVGRNTLLTLIGMVTNTSVALGYDNYLLTLRGPLLQSIYWAPWTLAGPFDYPADEGGPITNEPIWAATVNLHELAVAAKLIKPGAYATMFPAEPKWVDHGQVRPDTELRKLVNVNRRKRQKFISDWKAGRIELPKLKAPLAG